MAVRFDAIAITWSAGFGEEHTCRIEIGPDDQADPRLVAVVEWWREREAKIAAERQAADDAAGRDGMQLGIM